MMKKNVTIRRIIEKFAIIKKQCYNIQKNKNILKKDKINKSSRFIAGN